MDELTDDAITRDFRVYQRARGHRFSFDDVVTAWTAARAVPAARRIVDLGTGIGSVLIMLAWRFREASLAGIEAQEQSFELLGRNVERNDLGARVRVLHGDLRDRATQDAARAALCGDAGSAIDLVTGTPPYMPVSDGPISPDSQRAHARVELRGGVEDYVAGAARLAGDGTIVLCAGARRPDRVERAAAEAELGIAGRRDVIAREGSRGPLFTVWTLRRSAAFDEEPPLVLRDRSGARTRDAIELRASFGLATNPEEAPCP